MKQLLLILTFISLGFGLAAQQKLNVAEPRDRQLNDEYCTGIFSTQDATYFDLLDNRTNQSALAYFNILDWLQGRVAGLQIYRTQTNVSIPVIRNSLAGVFIDEMRVDYSTLNSIPVSDIAMVKIIRGPFIGSMGTPGGAILIYTKLDEESSEDVATK